MKALLFYFILNAARPNRAGASGGRLHGVRFAACKFVKVLYNQGRYQLWPEVEALTDTELYRRYLNGDEGALSELMARYGDALTIYIDGYLGDIHEAEDLMIEVFAYMCLKKPRLRDGAFKTYIYKAARHMALRHRGRWRAVFSLEDLSLEPEAEALVEEAVGSAERRETLRLCMERLHDDYREALYLTYFEDLSYAEAAEVMGKKL